MAHAAPSLGRLVSRRRRELALTQEQLASRARIGTSTLRALESGRAAGPSVYSVGRVLRALGLEAGELGAIFELLD